MDVTANFAYLPLVQELFHFRKGMSTPKRQSRVSFYNYPEGARSDDAKDASFPASAFVGTISGISI